ESNVPNTFSTGWAYTNGKMYDLAQSITPQSGFIVSNVETILDNGQILASGGPSFPDDLPPDGCPHATLQKLHQTINDCLSVRVKRWPKSTARQGTMTCTTWLEGESLPRRSRRS